MCLGVPGRIVDTWQADDGALLAHADFDGEVRVIRLNYLPDLAPGDFTIVHAGYALTRLDADEAGRTLQLLRDVGLLEPSPMTDHMTDPLLDPLPDPLPDHQPAEPQAADPRPDHQPA